MPTIIRLLLAIADFLWRSVIAALLSVAYAVTGVGVYLGLDDGDRPNLATAWLIAYGAVGVLALCMWCVRMSNGTPNQDQLSPYPEVTAESEQAGSERVR